MKFRFISIEFVIKCNKESFSFEKSLTVLEISNMLTLSLKHKQSSDLEFFPRILLIATFHDDRLRHSRVHQVAQGSIGTVPMPVVRENV